MKHPDRYLAALCAMVLTACGDGVSESGFVQGAQLGFTHDSGFQDQYFFPETFGSGLCSFDADGDGNLDLYAIQCGAVPGSGARSDAVNQLFLGDGSGHFEEATKSSGSAAHPGFGMGVCAGDLNGDGHSDLILSNLGSDAVLLGTGDSNNLFRDATPLAINQSEKPNWSSSVGLADFDRDGHLDLVILAYSDWHARNHKDCFGAAGLDYCDVNMFPGARDSIYRGDGKGGFQDYGQEWSFGKHETRGLGLALVDFDDDGFVDIYVANDTDPNHYFENLGGAGFTDKSALSGTSANVDGRFEAGMGVAIADVSGDGLADILVTNFTSEPNDLYVNSGRHRFRERSRPSGIAAPSMPKLGFGTTFADFDLDGREDNFVACGHVQRHAEERSSTWTWKQPDLLMMGDAKAHFSPASPGSFLATPRVGRGLAAGDFDGDGGVDLAISNSGAELNLALNRFHKQGDWLGVRLFQEASPKLSNTAAIGAKLTLELSDGQVLSRWIRSGTGYLSQDDQGQIFGIPRGLTVSSLQIRWPDGHLQTQTAQEISQLGLWIRINRD